MKLNKRLWLKFTLKLILTINILFPNMKDEIVFKYGHRTVSAFIRKAVIDNCLLEFPEFVLSMI